MTEENENSVSVNEAGFVLLPENFQTKRKPIQTLSKLNTVTEKKPQMSEKQMMKQMSSQLHNQKKVREEILMNLVMNFAHLVCASE